MFFWWGQWDKKVGKHCSLFLIKMFFQFQPNNSSTHGKVLCIDAIVQFQGQPEGENEDMVPFTSNRQYTLTG